VEDGTIEHLNAYPARDSLLRETGLPHSYYASLLGPDTTWTPYHINSYKLEARSEVGYLNWLTIPQGLVAELDELPWEHVFGQGLLVRDCRNRAALVRLHKQR